MPKWQNAYRTPVHQQLAERGAAVVLPIRAVLDRSGKRTGGKSKSKKSAIPRISMNPPSCVWRSSGDTTKEQTLLIGSWEATQFDPTQAEGGGDCVRAAKKGPACRPAWWADGTRAPMPGFSRTLSPPCANTLSCDVRPKQPPPPVVAQQEMMDGPKLKNMIFQRSIRKWSIEGMGLDVNHYLVVGFRFPGP